MLGFWGLFALLYRSMVGFLVWIALLACVSLGSIVASTRCLRHSPPPKAVSLWAAAVLGLAYLPALAVLVARATPARLYVTPTDSMVPTLEPGALLLVDVGAYRENLPERGDVVLFRSPLNPRLKLLKRVLGLPAERIAVQDDRVAVNGRPIHEPYLAPAPPHLSRNTAESTVPNDHVFVLGDNRPASFDSRAFGAIARSLLEGRVCYALPIHLALREDSRFSPVSDNL